MFNIDRELESFSEEDINTIIEVLSDYSKSSESRLKMMKDSRFEDLMNSKFSESEILSDNPMLKILLEAAPEGSLRIMFNEFMEKEMENEVKRQVKIGECITKFHLLKSRLDI
jgi:hypothetical protein